MTVLVERIYDAPQHKGYRVLADRLWPRGMSKERAHLDEWCKDVAPSNKLRTWFGHDPKKWREFSRLYLAELKDARDEARALLQRAGKKKLILLTGTKDMEHTHVLVLQKYLAALR